MRGNQEEFKMLAKKIRQCRKQMGWSQQVLADRAGISRGYLSKIETAGDGSSFSMDILFSLSKALKRSPSELLTWE
jgi:transcriptional regulator with XRE-family HTH domain